MKRINVLFAVIVSILFLAACTKEGETGPQGLQGDIQDPQVMMAA